MLLVPVVSLECGVRVRVGGESVVVRVTGAAACCVAACWCCAALSSGSRIVAVRLVVGKQASISCAKSEGKGPVVCGCWLLCGATVMRLRFDWHVWKPS